MNQLDSEIAADGVRLKGRGLARRLTGAWGGFGGEIIGIVERERVDIEYCGPCHLLIALVVERATLGMSGTRAKP